MNLPRTLKEVKPCIADMNFLDAITLMAKYQEERIKPLPTKQRAKKVVDGSVTITASTYRSKGKTKKPRKPKPINIKQIDLALLSKLTNLKLEFNDGESS